MGGPRARPRLLEHVTEIVEQYEYGYSIDALALRHAVNPSTMRKFLLSRDVTLRAPTRAALVGGRLDEATDLYAQGWTMTNLAKRYGLNRDTVSAALARRGVKRIGNLAALSFIPPTGADAGVMAGLLLGEGSIVFRPDGAVNVRIVNTDVDIIRWLEQWGGSVSWTQPRGGGRLPVGAWSLDGAANVYHCLTVLRPLLVGRKRRLAGDGLARLEARWGFRATA